MEIKETWFLVNYLSFVFSFPVEQGSAVLYPEDWSFIFQSVILGINLSRKVTIVILSLVFLEAFQKWLSNSSLVKACYVTTFTGSVYTLRGVYRVLLLIVYTGRKVVPQKQLKAIVWFVVLLFFVAVNDFLSSEAMGKKYEMVIANVSW